MADKLGYLNPVKQREQARTRSIPPELFLGESAPARTYVLSEDAKERIEENRKRQKLAEVIVAEGRIYLGSEAFASAKTVEFVSEPLLKYSYCSTAALRLAKGSAVAVGRQGGRSEFHLRHWPLGLDTAPVAGTLRSQPVRCHLMWLALCGSVHR